MKKILYGITFLSAEHSTAPVESSSAQQRITVSGMGVSERDQRQRREKVREWSLDTHCTSAFACLAFTSCALSSLFLLCSACRK